MAALTLDDEVKRDDLVPDDSGPTAKEETKEKVNSKMLDAYGFEVSADEAKKRWSKEKKKIVEKTNERLEKWLDMLKDWESVDQGKLKTRCRKGIPDAVRGDVWLKLTGADILKKNSPGKYNQLCFEEPEKKYADVIDKDLARTFPKHDIFINQSELGQKGLQKVLRAYAVYDQEVGYCQGMGFLAALFLMYMTEEDAFWILVSILSDDYKYKMRGLFTDGLPLLRQRFFQLKKLVEIFCPALSKRFELLHIHPSCYATKWFMTGFAHVLPFPTVVRIWDMYLYEGNKIIFRIALQCLKENEGTLLKLDMNKQDDQEEFYKVLQSIDQNIKPEQLVKDALNIKLTTAQIEASERQWLESETLL